MRNARKRHLNWILVGLILLLGVSTLNPARAWAASPRQDDAPTTYIYFFWGDGCPHCADAKPFLQKLERQSDNVVVESFEVWYNPKNQALFVEMAEAAGFNPEYVPTIQIGEQYWVGFSDVIASEIEAKVAACAETGCIDPGVGIIPGHEPQPDTEPQERPTAIGNQTTVIKIPFFGEVELKAYSLWISTALISFADGFNPCSLWVLSILIALTLRTGSRKKIFTIGVIYITVTAGVYVLFIAGLFTMLTVVSFLTWIQAAVSVLALFFALVNIKDYFWYKQGLSFTIADEKKPGIYKGIRKVMNAGDSFWSLAAATVGLGVGVSLVEFSCTAGLPVVWTNLVAAQDVSTTTFVLLLLLYMIIYQIDELGIFLVAVFTLRASRLEEKHGRILKLAGGMLMLTLSVVMLANPALMNNLTSSLVIFGIAFAVTALVLFVHRAVLPRFGIYIGSEMKAREAQKRPRRTEV